MDWLVLMAVLMAALVAVLMLMVVLVLVVLVVMVSVWEPAKARATCAAWGEARKRWMTKLPWSCMARELADGVCTLKVTSGSGCSDRHVSVDSVMPLRAPLRAPLVRTTTGCDRLRAAARRASESGGSGGRVAGCGGAGVVEVLRRGVVELCTGSGRRKRLRIVVEDLQRGAAALCAGSGRRKRLFIVRVRGGGRSRGRGGICLQRGGVVMVTAADDVEVMRVGWSGVGFVHRIPRV